jgi:uncharacterized protein
MWFPKRSVHNTVQPRSAGTLHRARERLPWPKDRYFRILSIDGGGIRGILPLAVLARLEQTYLGGGSIADYFDMVVGTSTGGIIALGLGAGYNASDLLRTYIERGGEVFPDHCSLTKRMLGIWQIAFNRCNNEHLNNLIDAVLGKRQLWESRIRTCIPAAETQHFEPFIFKTPHHPDYRLDWKEPMAHIASRTAAAPTIFKPVKRNDGYEFVDGGIWANNPIMVGIADTLSCFDLRREQIKVLSLGCVRDQFSMSWSRRQFGGQFFWKSIMIESMYIQSQNVIGQARLIVGHERVTRLDAPPVTPKIEMWNWKRCCAELPTMAEELFKNHGQQIATDFFSTPAQVYTPYYKP